MSDAPIVIQRPQRWDNPFSQEMSDGDVDRALAVGPLSRVDPDEFPTSASLRDIVRNDSRINRYREGDIVIRAGDYSNSAFVVLAGKIHVVVEPMLDDDVLGRRKVRKKDLFTAFSQLWRNSKLPEFRDFRRYQRDASVGLRRTDTDEARVFLQDLPRILEDHRTVELGPGEMFGEIATIARTPRTTTVFADGEAELLEVRWQGIRDVRRRSVSFGDYVDRLYRERSLKVHLRESPMFRHLDETAMAETAEVTLFETYGDCEWSLSYKKLIGKSHEERIKAEPVISEVDHYPDGLIMIRRGFARVSERVDHGERTVATLTHGDAFGFEEIAHNWRSEPNVSWQHTLRALGYCDILRIPTAIVEKYVLPTIPEDQLPQPITVSGERRSAWRRSEGEDIEAGLFEFLVENRFINGSATMIIDNDRCVRCDECVRACATAHDGNPRFIRHGRSHGRFMVANACMHCVDPVCMIGCPTGAIHREAEGGVVVINDLTCIGCATCANSCPYDNIRMVQIREDRGTFIRDEATNAALQKATKCDLCVDQLGGPACQRACPHDAMIRIDMRDRDRLANWLTRR